MKVRMLMDVSGTFHNREGVKRGDVVDVDDESAENYVRLGYAEKDTGKKVDDGPELLQVADSSTVYVTKEEAAEKEEDRVRQEAAAVNTPDPKVDHDVEEDAKAAGDSARVAADTLSPSEPEEPKAATRSAGAKHGNRK